MDNLVMEWIVVLLVVPLIIGMAGQVAQRLVGAKRGDPGWRGIYVVTVPWHAMLVGAGVGFAMFKLQGPIPEVFGSAVGGYLLAYTMSGAVSIVGYDTIVKVFKNFLDHLHERSG